MALFIVTTTSASGSGSLAEAITLAASNAGHDDIVFDASLNDTTILTAGTLILAQDVSIDGDIDDDGAFDITLNGSLDHRLMTVYTGANVHIDGIRFYQGYQRDFVPGEDAVSGVLNAGTLSITHSVFEGNTAIGADGITIAYFLGQDGGNASTVFNTSAGTLTLHRVSFTGNTATAGFGGVGEDGQPGSGDFGNSGQTGGNGGHAASAVLNEGTASLSLVSGVNNVASGGNGGSGGFGESAAIGGNGGNGGDGGRAATFLSTSGTIEGSLRDNGFNQANGGIGGNGGLYGNGVITNGTSGTPGAGGITGFVVAGAPVGTVHLVTSSDDTGPGSLRDVIAGAAAGDTIIFDQSLKDQTIRLTTTELAITRDLTIDGDIDGDGRADITISGDKNDSGTNNSGDVRIFNISGPTTDVTLRGLTLTGGRADLSNGEDGGAILTSATSTLRIEGVTITSSYAASGGGGIYANYDFTAINSLFHGNSAFLGGALYVKGDYTSLFNTTMTGNSAVSLGGAIDTDTGSNIRLFNSTITENQATIGGGGIDVFSSKLYVYNSILSGNTTSGAGADVRSDLTSGPPNEVHAAYSLLGTGVTLTHNAGHNISSNNPFLRVLQDNGGPVWTMAPLSGSAAIDAGSIDQLYLVPDLMDIDHDGDTTELTPIDARGIARVLGNSVDIGAVELPAVDDATFIAEGFGTVSGNVLTNDGGSNKSVTGLQAGTESEAGSFGSFISSSEVDGTYGTLEILSDGSFTYTLDNTDPTVQALASGQSVFDFFTYRVDQNGLWDIATLNVAVNGINDAPVGVNDNNAGDAVVEATTTSAGDAQATGNVLTNDTDTDTGDSKAVGGIGVGNLSPSGVFTNVTASFTTIAGTYGSLKIKADGTYQYLIDNTNLQTRSLYTGQTGHDIFTYRVKDGFGITAVAVLDIGVAGANDAPVAANDTLATSEDTAVIFTAAQLLGNDSDEESGLPASIASVTSGTGGTAVLNSNGTVTFTPTANFNGAATFTYVARDDTSLLSSQATVTVNVSAVNDVPVITSNGGGATASVAYGENGTTPVTTVTATDVESTITYSLGGTDSSKFSLNATTGALAFRAAPDFEMPSDSNGDNVYQVIVRANDGFWIDEQAIAVTITNTVGNTIAGTKKADTIDLTHGRSGKFATGEEDAINGKAGNDTIKALGGNDTVKGGTGVDDLDGGDGIDAVDFSDMTLGVELTLKGSKQAIAKVGGVADDKLKNFESILGGKAGDKLTGDGKANLLAGNAGNDSLNGGKGIDTLKGGLGADTLTGGKGAVLDVFLFDAKLGSGNIDVVTDFKHGIDKLALDDAIFAAIGPTLETGELFSKTGAVKAKQLDDRLIYDTKTGNLSYDADGKGGAAAIHFATILDGSKPAVLDTTDVLIV